MRTMDPITVFIRIQLVTLQRNLARDVALEQWESRPKFDAD